MHKTILKGSGRVKSVSAGVVHVSVMVIKLFLPIWLGFGLSVYSSFWSKSLKSQHLKTKF